MDFPVHFFGLHPHQVFDILSLLVGAQLFWWGLRRQREGALQGEDKWTVAGGCLVGAALGAKAIVLLEDPPATLFLLSNPAFWVSGKSIVGALLGGLLGVELAKKAAGIATSTGDHFVLPLCVGLAIGRLGCFFSGLEDDAYGIRTALPWGVDFGDGPRHPTQLYEVGFALLFLAALPALRRRSREAGDLFRLFMVSYFAFRFLEEFFRVAPRPYLGLTVYQLACAAGLAYYLKDRATRTRLARLAGRPAPAQGEPRRAEA